MSQGNAKRSSSGINNVVVNGSAAVGQVLTATSPITANWQYLPDGAVIFKTTIISSPENIASNRSFNQSPITSSELYEGSINLSSDTTNATAGITGSFNAIVGGDQNVISGSYDVIGGGYQNSISSSWGFIGGGQNNTIFSDSTNIAAIGGGSGNIIGGYGSFIGGGTNNQCTQAINFIGGGSSNETSGGYAGIVAGVANGAGGEYSFIGAGFGNVALADYSSVINGYSNGIYQNSKWSNIIGGLNNVLFDQFGIITSGQLNTISQPYNTGTTASVAVNADSNLTAASIMITSNGGTGTVSGFTGLTTAVIGETLTISGSNSQNNGNWIIIGLASSTTVIVQGYSVYSGTLNTDTSGAASATGFSVQVSGLSGMVITQLGGAITLSNSSGNNNGVFFITQFINSGSVQIASQFATTEGADLHWSVGSQLATISGQSNIVYGGSSGILSGSLQSVNGNASAIASGSQNIADSNYTFIGGGGQNSSYSDNNFIGAGYQNTIGGNSVPGYAAIVAGLNNTIGYSSGATFIGGGQGNSIGVISATGWGTITGGQNNTLYGSYGFMGGGYGNLAGGGCAYSVMVGGLGNTSQGYYSFVGSGQDNNAGSDWDVICGGSSNTTGGPQHGFVGGGLSNTAGTNDGNGYDAVVGGNYNLATGGNSSIVGGSSNTIYSGSQYSFIGGGTSNAIGGSGSSSTNAVIAGGASNTIGLYSGNCFIGAGETNSIGNESGLNNIVGGLLNSIGDNVGWSNIGGGQNNTIGIVSGNNVVFSTITGGQFNNIFQGYANGSGASIAITADSSLTSASVTITVTGSYVDVSGFSGLTNSVIGETLIITSSPNTSNNGNFAIIGMRNGTDVIIYNPGAITDVSGSATATGQYVTLSNLSGMASTMVGASIYLSGSSSSGNNGAFQIASYIDTADVTIINANAVTDASLDITWDLGSHVSFIGNGQWNQINGANSGILVGSYNLIDGNASTISGGTINIIDGNFGFIGSGQTNVIYDGTNYCTLVGGQNNLVGSNTNYAFIGGGQNNAISTPGGGEVSYAVITGGQTNYSGSGWGFIGAGANNSLNNGNSWGFIGAGQQNSVQGDNSGVACGFNNFVTGLDSFIGGGQGNQVNAGYASIPGGENCETTGQWSTAFGFQNTANGSASVAIGGYTTASRDGQFAYSSSSSFLGTSQGDSQYGHLTLANQQSTIGSSFSLSTVYGAPQEFTLLNPVSGQTQYYSINIRVIMMANNANVGPVTQVWEVMAYTVGGIATIAGSPSNTFTSDPNATGWTSEITVDGTTNLLHITVLPNGDVTNTINAMADLNWAEIAAFAQ